MSPVLQGSPSVLTDVSSSSVLTDRNTDASTSSFLTDRAIEESGSDQHGRSGAHRSDFEDYPPTRRASAESFWAEKLRELLEDPWRAWYLLAVSILAVVTQICLRIAQEGKPPATARGQIEHLIQKHGLSPPSPLPLTPMPLIAATDGSSRTFQQAFATLTGFLHRTPPEQAAGPSPLPLTPVPITAAADGSSRTFQQAVATLTGFLHRTPPDQAAGLGGTAIASSSAVASGCGQYDEACHAQMLDFAEAASYHQDTSLFYTVLKDWVLYTIFMLSLYAFSYAGLRRYQRRRWTSVSNTSPKDLPRPSAYLHAKHASRRWSEEAALLEDDGLPFALCALAVSVALGSVLLVPMTVLDGLLRQYLSHEDLYGGLAATDLGFIWQVSTLCVGALRRASLQISNRLIPGPWPERCGVACGAACRDAWRRKACED